ncbi:MAG: hypothetical protein R2940_16735 [Syntrophotaleaceae bacterium]
MVTADEVEAIVRRVVREEMALLLEALKEKPAVFVQPEVYKPPPAEGWPGSFLISDRELAMAERLLPEAERKILYMRVMAARLAAAGNHASANRMRKRADNLERQLRGKT